jgi:predicted nucleotidyltransferase
MTSRLITKLSNYFASQPIEKAWIFGSYARTEENRKSDIDILVNFSNDTKITLFKYVHIINDLEALTRRKVDLVEEGQLKTLAKESANQDKILIYERKTT